MKRRSECLNNDDVRGSRETGVNFVHFPSKELYQRYLPDRKPDELKVWYDQTRRKIGLGHHARKGGCYHNRLANIDTLTDKCKFAQLIQTTGIPASTPYRREQTEFPANFTFPCLAKPAKGSQGYGIMLINDKTQLQTIPPNKDYVLSSYVDNLLLYEEKKIHLRYYVLVLPFRQTVWLYGKGIGLFAANQFNSASSDVRGVHLTNGCDNPIYSSTLLQNAERDVLQRLSVTLRDIFVAWFASNASKTDDKAFSILAIDVLVDKQFRPFILEFNGSWHPMIANSVKEDVACKHMMPAFLSLVRTNGKDAPRDDNECILCYQG